MEYVYLYTLTDPRTGQVKYVGTSKSPSNRFDQHRYRSHSLQLGEWFKELKLLGLSPMMSVIRAVPKAERDEVEQAALMEFGNDVVLLNVSNAPKKASTPKTGDVLKTFRIGASLVADIQRLAEYYGSARRVLEIAVGMLDKSSGHVVDEPRGQKLSSQEEAKAYRNPVLAVIDDIEDAPLTLDAVAEPGKAKVSFERERKPLLKPAEKGRQR